MRNPVTGLFSRRKNLEWLLLNVALVFVGAVFTSVHVAEVHRVDATERDRLHVLTSIVSNDIQSNLTTVSLTLEKVIKDYLVAPGRLHSPDGLTLRLEALQTAIQGTCVFLVLDANGQVTATSEPALLGKDLRNEAYFKLARDNPSERTLYVSAPFQSYKEGGGLVITVSRMVRGTHGEFAGLMVAGLNQDFFTDSFLPVGYAPDAWGFVVHSDGRLLINFPTRAGIDGRDVSQPGTFFSRHIQSGQVENVLTGVVRGTGEQRLMTLQTVQPASLNMDKAIVVGLSRSQAAIAQPLRRQALVYGLLYAGIALVCCGGLFWVQKRRAYAQSLADDLERERRETDERTKHNQVLSESEARFRTLIEDAPLAVAILRGGYFVYSNPRYRDLHGYSAGDDLTGLPWRAMISAESRALLREQEALIIADSPIEQMFEAQGLGKEGRVVPVFKTTARVQLLDGPATLIFAQDISAQKHAESALLQARDAAQAANRSKADFLANMSHEIRSPLNAILGLAYLLGQARLNLDAHGMVRKIVASGRMLLNIINDILDVSKIEAGHLLIERAPFRLNDVIDNLAVTMGLTVADKNIHLIIQPLPAGVSSVMGDALRLEQVLNNLTSNAIKFTHVGQVELRIALVSRDDEKIVLRFAVHDTGIGIPPELQGEVFSAFTQADTSTTRRFGGTGLGLTICRQLVSLMGGEIGVNSTLGQGSEFWFTVPLQLVPSTEFSSPDMVRIDALIADDSEIALQAVTDTAKGLGWQVSTVRSGEAVLAQLLERKEGKLPDVVLLDWKMPGMDGLATVRAIRENMPKEACPIVIMATAYALPSLASQPGAELVDAFLNKPVTSSTLYNATVEAQRKRANTVGAPDVLRKSAAQALAGVRILIVDDSEINRDVAQRILGEQGAVSSLAVDGKAAVDWLVAHPDDVDLVLMDVQMPVMDGIEATRRLRLMPQFNDLPIVALTAGAFKEQQDAARAAGMTHFISKPFDVPSTVALIEQIRRKQANAVSVAGNAEIQAQADHSDFEQSAEFSVIDIRRGLKIWSDVQTYRDYLRRFVASYGNAMEEINASLVANDRPAAAKLAHKLAGVAANLVLPDTQRLATETERILSTGYDSTFILARLSDALEQAVMAIDRFAPKVEAQPQACSPATGEDMSPETRAELKVLFVALLDALNQDSPAPVKPVLVKLLTALPVQELAGIQECIRDFDFRRAETTTIKLALTHGIILEG